MIDILVIFEKRDTFWERLIIRFQNYSHVAIVMEGMKIETHPKHGVIVSKFSEGAHPERRTKIEHRVTYKIATHIKRETSIHTGKGYNYLSILQGLIYGLTGFWIGGKPDKFNCATWVAFCLWPESEWWKYDIKAVMERLIGDNINLITNH